MSVCSKLVLLSHVLFNQISKISANIRRSSSPYYSSLRTVLTCLLKAVTCLGLWRFCSTASSCRTTAISICQQSHRSQCNRQCELWLLSAKRACLLIWVWRFSRSSTKLNQRSLFGALFFVSWAEPPTYFRSLGW